MTYKAVVRFADLEDGRRIYEPGDAFPRLGLSVTEERLKKLAGSDNLAGQPLIRAFEEERSEEPAAETRSARPRKRKAMKK